jgi:VanZ family protein
VHQLFVPGRVGSPIDVAIDSIGVAVGILLWRRYRAASAA